VPVLDPLFPELPAQLNGLAVANRRKVDQPLERPLELDAHAVESGHRLEQLQLRATDGVASLLVPVTIFGPGRWPLGFVLGDARLVLELGQEGGKLRDLRDDPFDARQFPVRLVHGVRAEPLHGSTIAPMRSTLHRMEEVEARRLLAASKVAHLATVSAGGRPHVVPIVFALDGETLYFAIDAKPKKTTRLARLKNIAANPAVSVLVDHYEDNWTRLWWVRADGTAHIVTADDEAQRAIDLLAMRYQQYVTERPRGPVVAIHVDRLVGWTGA
jgi:PPOX class probable F420-dependent enzyme